MKKSELKRLIREIIKENMGAFKQDMDSDMRGILNKVKHSDYAKGDDLYTVTGAPVKFISDLTPDKKTGEQRAMVSDKDGARYSTFLKHITPEQPSKEDALSFIASRYKNYDEFVNAAARRGYDAQDNLKNIWDSSK